MESFLLVVLLVVLLICWVVLSGRISDLRRRIEEQDTRPADARLIARIFALEKEVAELRRERAISAAGNIAAEPVTTKTVVAAAAAVPPPPKPASPKLRAHPSMKSRSQLLQGLQAGHSPLRRSCQRFQFAR
jgi:hypothetical protein